MVDELDELRRNTEYNANTYRRPINRTVISGLKRKTKMISASIVSLTEFNVSEYLQNLSSGLTVGQAAHLLPQYHIGMQQAVQRSQSKNVAEREANLVESDEEEAITAAKVTLRVNGKVQTVIVDSRAATSIITRSLMDQLGCTIDQLQPSYILSKEGTK